MFWSTQEGKITGEAVFFSFFRSVIARCQIYNNTPEDIQRWEDSPLLHNLVLLREFFLLARQCHVTESLDTR